MLVILSGELWVDLKLPMVVENMKKTTKEERERGDSQDQLYALGTFKDLIP